MARESQTDLAVLAALSVAPMTGYAVRESIRQHLAGFWSESFGQIYPALRRLRDTGMLDVEAGGRAGSALHRLTPAGRARLVELMREPAVADPPRNGVLLRLFFGDALGAAACRDLVLDARDRALARLEELAVARTEAEAGDPDHRPYWLITISAGEHSARATIAWADETLDALEALA